MCLPAVIFRCLLVGSLVAAPQVLLADDATRETNTFVRGVIKAKCATCHGEKDPKGGVNLIAIVPAEPRSTDSRTTEPRSTEPRGTEHRTSQAELLQRALEAIDANDMPPADEPQLTRDEREALLRHLKVALRAATSVTDSSPPPMHRLTRFQYNNAVRDLFQLNRDLFDLPEKLIVRRDGYVTSATGKMPDRVDVAARGVQAAPILDGVKAYPKDLRAEHGFDNQANKLTLSPLLLDAFLRLSVSIVESPDFNPQTVGVWNELFEPPVEGVEPGPEIERRLKPFLRHAFRGPVDADTIRRYADYARTKLTQGATFTAAMKKTASAALCSPLFLYRASAADGSASQFELASRLSFFLWASIPDAELLDLAERGQLAQPDVLRASIDRMLNDPKIERFLDTFPTQWLQLENALAVTPDPKRSRYFHVDPELPASAAMVLEPLLLFDALFVENRPVIELIAPPFAYRNEFLRDWYATELAPPRVDEQAVIAHNRQLEDQRQRLTAIEAESRRITERILAPVRAAKLAERRQTLGDTTAVDLKPIATWEFNGDLKDSLRTPGLDLMAHGQVRFADGKIILERAYLQSRPLAIDLRAKTLEVWCELPDVNQRGGGVMTIQGPGDFFDSIVLGERQPGHWISGSNGFARTEDFPESTPETTAGQRVHLAMVYDEDGTTRLYRNGLPYGKPFRKGAAVFPQGLTTVLFGLRHVPAGGNKYLAVTLDRARLYDRALTADEVRAAAAGYNLDLSEQELVQALKADDAADWKAAKELGEQSRTQLAKLPPPQDLPSMRQTAQRAFEDQLRRKLRSTVFQRDALQDPRYGGVITNAAVLSMTSGPQRTQPIARGSWIVEVVFNDPPPPPPNNVPPLNEADNSHLTIREQFAAHRENPSCAGCHAKIDPLGFALENFDITGRWRDKYENGRPVDASGTLLRRHDFSGVVEFKSALIVEKQRFARAFVAHLLRFGLARELTPRDSFTIDQILREHAADDYPLRALIRAVAVRS